MSSLTISLVQYNIAWKNKEANFDKISALCSDSATDMIVLPEMFQTGFCIDDVSQAESMEGKSVSWLIEFTTKHQNAICGSILIKEEEHVFNRFILVSKGEVVGYYDKTHVFVLGGEHKHITPGNTKADMVLNGFKIRPIVCYDLRFPYTSFNDTEYDLLINTANWPSTRILHWDALLQARSIENQAYVIGCNRVGEQDGIFYPGHSSAYAPSGEKIVHSVKEEILTFTINKKAIEDTRNELPFLQDRRM